MPQSTPDSPINGKKLPCYICIKRRTSWRRDGVPVCPDCHFDHLGIERARSLYPDPESVVVEEKECIDGWAALANLDEDDLLESLESTIEEQDGQG